MRALTTIVLILAVGACEGPDPDVSDGPAEDTAATSDPAASAAPDTPRTRGPAPVDLEGHVLVDSVSADLTGDGVAERIELHVQAERLPDGRPLWEDGHRWVLLVHHDGRTFPVVDEFVPHGRVGFRVVERPGPGPAAGASILVEVDSSTGGVRLAEHVFEPDGGGYRTREVLRVEGQVIHRTPEEAYR